MSDPIGVGLALAAGVLQGVVEWLPISSEGNVAILLTAAGRDPAEAVRLSLVLHLGTALAATAYYRERFAALPAGIADCWRVRGRARTPPAREALFVVAATVAAGLTGVAGYLLLASVVSHLTGGAFLAAIGIALIASGVLQRVASGVALGGRRDPTLLDAGLIGALQGLAVLPGISRSGVTVGGLLLRGYDGEAAFDLSFLLSVPAAIGAATLVVLDVGLPAVAPAAAIVALLASAAVGYLTIDVLLRTVRRVPIWGVCVGLGLIATLGGIAVAV